MVLAALVWTSGLAAGVEGSWYWAIYLCDSGCEQRRDPDPDDKTVATAYARLRPGDVAVFFLLLQASDYTTGGFSIRGGTAAEDSGRGISISELSRGTTCCRLISLLFATARSSTLSS